MFLVAKTVRLIIAPSHRRCYIVARTRSLSLNIHVAYYTWSFAVISKRKGQQWLLMSKSSESNILHWQKNKSEEKLKRKFRISKMITFRLCMNIFGIRITFRYRDPVINNFRRDPKRRIAQNCDSTAALILFWDIDVHAILGDIYFR